MSDEKLSEEGKLTGFPIDNSEQDPEMPSEEAGASLRRILLPVTIFVVIIVVVIITVLCFKTQDKKEYRNDAFIEKLELDIQILNLAVQTETKKLKTLQDENEKLFASERISRQKLESLSEGVTEGTDISLILGESGSGFISADELQVKKAHVFSFGGPYNDPELGLVWIPNENEGRGFVVAKNSTMPNFVYHTTKPEGLVPILHPTRKEGDRHFVVFVKK